MSCDICNLKKVKLPICAIHGDTINPIVMTIKDDEGNEINITNSNFEISVLNENQVEVSRFDMSNGLTILTNKLVWNFGNTVSIPSGKHLYFIKKIDGLVEETLFYGDILISKQKV